MFQSYQICKDSKKREKEIKFQWQLQLCLKVKQQPHISLCKSGNSTTYCEVSAVLQSILSNIKDK